MASRAGHIEVAEFLLQNGAPVDAKAKVMSPDTQHVIHHDTWEHMGNRNVNKYKVITQQITISVEFVFWSDVGG